MQEGKMYRAAVTFGRFNLPHKGHLKLWLEMWRDADVVVIGISNNAKNLPYPARAKVIVDMLSKHDVNFTVVDASNPFEAFDVVAKMGFEPNEVLAAFGEDQFALSSAANKAFGWDTIEVERLTSSTALRSLIDNQSWDLVASQVPGHVISQVVKLRELELKPTEHTMPRIELKKLADNAFDADVTLSFDTDLLQTAQSHYEDFLKACGFEIPDGEDTLTFERRLETSDKVIPLSDFMWGTEANDGIKGSTGIDYFPF